PYEWNNPAAAASLSAGSEKRGQVMSLIVSSGGPTMVTPPYPVSKLTVDGYHRMIQTGILTEDDPVEFLEGWIVPKMPHNPPHDGTVQRANKVLGRHLRSGWEVRV